VDNALTDTISDYRKLRPANNKDLPMTAKAPLDRELYPDIKWQECVFTTSHTSRPS
jgi:hypothetical protein